MGASMAIARGMNPRPCRARPRTRPGTQPRTVAASATLSAQAVVINSNSPGLRGGRSVVGVAESDAIVAATGYPTAASHSSSATPGSTHPLRRIVVVFVAQSPHRLLDGSSHHASGLRIVHVQRIGHGVLGILLGKSGADGKVV